MNPDEFFNSLHAKFFIGNKNIYLHLMSFLHTGMRQVVEILPQVIEELIYSTYSISWLLMSWHCKEPGHQQPWYFFWTKLIRPPQVRVNIITKTVCIFHGIYYKICPMHWHWRKINIVWRKIFTHFSSGLNGLKFLLKYTVLGFNTAPSWISFNF